MTATRAQPIKSPMARKVPLESGDRMTRTEFERRWETLPELKRAELVEGVVYVAAATRQREHGRPHAHLIGWLLHFEARTVYVDLGDAPSLRLDEDNEPQPDAMMRIPHEAGGRSRIDDDGFIVGGPELVAEISASTVSLDMHDKLNVYRRHGVKEYIVWRVLDESIDWFTLREGRFEPMPRGGEGVVKSGVFPGLWLDTAAMLRGDLQQVIATLDEGLKTPEHQAFFERLKEALSR